MDTADGGKYSYAAGAAGSPDPLVSGELECFRDDFRVQRATTTTGEVYVRGKTTDNAFQGEPWIAMPSTRRLFSQALLDSMELISGLQATINPDTQKVEVSVTLEDANQAFIWGNVTIPRDPTSTKVVLEPGIAADTQVNLEAANGVAETLLGGNWSREITVQPGVSFTITTTALNAGEYLGPDQSADPEFFYWFIDNTGQVSLRGPKGDKGDTGDPSGSIFDFPDFSDAGKVAGAVAIVNALNDGLEVRKLTTADLADFEQSPQEGEIVVRRGNAWVGEELVQGLTRLDQMQDIEGTPRPGQMIQRSSTGQSFVYADTPRSVNKLIGAGASANINDTNPHLSTADSYQKVQAITPVVPIPAEGDWFLARIHITQVSADKIIGVAQREISRVEIEALTAATPNERINADIYASDKVSFIGFAGAINPVYLTKSSDGNLMPLWSFPDGNHPSITIGAGRPFKLHLTLYEITGKSQSGGFELSSLGSPAAVNFTASDLNKFKATTHPIDLDDLEADTLELEITPPGTAPYFSVQIPKAKLLALTAVSAGDAVSATNSLKISTELSIGRNSDNELLPGSTTAGDVSIQGYDLADTGEQVDLTPVATTTTAGKVELATDAEAAAVHLDDKALTPSNLAAVDIIATKNMPAAPTSPKMVVRSANAWLFQDIPMSGSSVDIPAVDARIAAEVETFARIGNTAGVPVAKIPNLDASKITSGTIDSARLPSGLGSGGRKLQFFAALPALAGYANGELAGVEGDAIYEKVPAAGSSATSSLSGWSPTVKNIQGGESQYGFDLRANTPQSERFGTRPPGWPTTIGAFFMEGSDSRFNCYADVGVIGHDGLDYKTNRFTYQSTADGEDLFWTNPVSSADEWDGSALVDGDDVHSISTTPFNPTSDIWSRVLSQEGLTQGQFYAMSKVGWKAGRNTIIIDSDDNLTRTINVGVPSGNSLPEFPHIGDRYKLLTADTIPHNIVLQANAGLQHPTAGYRQYTLINANAPFTNVQLHAYDDDWTGVDQRLKGKVWLSGMVPAATDQWPLGAPGTPPRTFHPSASALSGTSFYQIQGIDASALGAWIITSPSRGTTKAYDDVVVQPDDLAFAGEGRGSGGWVHTPGTYSEPQAERHKYFITMRDGEGPGLSIASTSTTVQSAIALYNPPKLTETTADLDEARYKAGMFDTSLRAVIVNPSDSRLSFSPTSIKTEIHVSDAVSTSDLRHASEYVAGQEYGVQVDEDIPLYVGGTKVSDLKYFQALNSNHELLSYDKQVGGSGTYRCSIQWHESTYFAPTDSTALPDATTTVKGIVELATDAEARATTSPAADKAITPANLFAAMEDWARKSNNTDVPVDKIPNLSASKINSGVFDSTRLPKATGAQVEAGNTDAFFITPARISSVDFKQLKGTPTAYEAGKILESTATATRWVDKPSGGTATIPSSGVVAPVRMYRPVHDAVINAPSTQGTATTSAGVWSVWTNLMDTDAATEATALSVSSHITADETGSFSPSPGGRGFIQARFVKVAADGTTETPYGEPHDDYIRGFDADSSKFAIDFSTQVDLAVGEKLRIEVRVRKQNNVQNSEGTATYTFRTTENEMTTRKWTAVPAPKPVIVLDDEVITSTARVWQSPSEEVDIPASKTWKIDYTLRKVGVSNAAEHLSNTIIIKTDNFRAKTATGAGLAADGDSIILYVQSTSGTGAVDKIHIGRTSTYKLRYARSSEVLSNERVTLIITQLD